MSVGRKSWVERANDPDCGFGLENLPYCVFVLPDMRRHVGIGIGDNVLDLNRLSRTGLLHALPWKLRSACRREYLNRLMECDAGQQSQLRKLVADLLSEELAPAHRDRVGNCLRAMSETRFCVPVRIGDYTDFYASVHHATNVGKLFRPDQPLLPNYKWVPIGYHGRASSILVSGTPVRRPNGQTKAATAEAPVFGPSRQMDYELELGAYIGGGNALGECIDVNRAEEHLFGVTLVNDWSARDIQAWEYQPLGPFLGKSFATTVSPWVVAMEALEPFRVPLAERAEGDPQPLPYLAARDASKQGIDLRLEVWLSTEAMRRESLGPVRLSEGNARELYWSFAQMVAHHTSNGCNLRAGDLIASGTVSGPQPRSRGCLLEITRRGAEPLRLPSGEERSFLDDGDEITLRGFCEREGLLRVSLGECKGRLVPATLSSRAAAAAR